MTDLTQWLSCQRALCDAATPGPWTVAPPDEDYVVLGPDGKWVAELYGAVKQAPKDAIHVVAWSPDRARRVLAALEKAAVALAKCDVVLNSEEFKSVFIISQIHHCPYTGGTVNGELDDLRAALAALEAP